jgi:hypothetical protein
MASAAVGRHLTSPSSDVQPESNPKGMLSTVDYSPHTVPISRNRQYYKQIQGNFGIKTVTTYASLKKSASRTSHFVK